MEMLKRVATVDDLRAIAERRLPRPVFDFIEGAAFRERTRTRNVEDFAQFRFRQRVLARVPERRLSTSMLGVEAAFPVAIAPTGFSGAMSGDGRGELHAARAAQRAGVPFTLGMLSLTSLEEITQELGAPWFQIAMLTDRAVMRGLVERADKLGVPVLALTLTWFTRSQMNRSIRNPYARFPPSLAPRSLMQYAARPCWSLGALTGRPPRLRNLDPHIPNAAPATTMGMLDAMFSWDDVAWLRALWPRKLVLKGITNADEVERAVAAGVDGVIVSNHGGNQLDEGASTISMLPEVVAAAGGRIEVLLDGGVRSGQDVLKALALGARGCLIGRAHLYGLAAAREAGVAKVLAMLRAELDATAALVGLADVAEASRAILRE